MLPASSPIVPAALCVSIHDVAPATWDECARWLEALAPLGPLPLTLLVVPDYHGKGSGLPAWYRRSLERRLALGDELALHGWRHVDDGPPPAGLAQWLRRRIYTAGEGEFAALAQAEAALRLEQGRAWFAALGWPLAGFVAPAWLLGEGAWTALDAAPRFAYTTTLSRFHTLAPRRSLPAPCIAYSARSLPRRAASLTWNTLPHGREAPLLRVALHPADVRHPAIVRQVVGVVQKLMAEREAMTKARFAARLSAA